MRLDYTDICHTETLTRQSIDLFQILLSTISDLSFPTPNHTITIMDPDIFN